MNYENDLLAVGHTALDYIIQINDFPQPNSSTSIRNMKTFHGGAAANVAVVAANLGLKSSLVSAVGDEFTGSEYEKLFKSLSIDIDDMIIVDGEKSPTAFVMTNLQNDQISYFYWGAAKYFKNSPVPKDMINKAHAVHLATGDPEFNLKCGKTAHELNKLISFDPGQDLHMYSPDNLKDVIKISNILFGNHHEIDRILKILDVDVNGLHELGPEIVVKTLGKNGSTIYTHEKIDVGAHYVKTVDPTGAGDSYRAGFLRAYLNGKDLEFCGKFAAAVASFIVEAEGCQTNIPTYDKALTRMNE